MQQNASDDFSLKNYFVPFTTLKAVHFIIILGLVVFGNVLFNAFVWDDKTYIINNPQLHAVNILPLFQHNDFNNAGQYRPLPALYFATLYSFFHDIPFFYHLLQISIHTVNTLLLFFFFKKFFNHSLSFFLSVVFLVHPIQVESVSFIAATVSPLFFFFGMLALVLSQKEKLNTKNLLLIFSLVLLSALTKETGFLFMFLIFLYRILFKKGCITKLFVAGCITMLLYFALRFGIGEIYFTQRELTPIAQLTLTERLLNIPAIIVYYLKTFFFPLQLVIQQNWVVKNMTTATFYLPLFISTVFFTLVIFLGVSLRKIDKKAFNVFLFFFFWFVVGLSLHLQLIPLDMTVADRWFYFPMVGLLGTVAASLQACKLSKKKMLLLCSAGALLIILFATRTIMRNGDWKDAITLYTHDALIADNFLIENDLGVEYGTQKKYQEALTHFKKSVAFFPHEGNVYNVGYIYDQLGQRQQAKAYYRQALHTKNYYPIAHKHNLRTYIGLGKLLIMDDKPQEAKTFLKTALLDYPQSGDLWSQLAVSEYLLQNQEEALFAAKKAVTLLPSHINTALYVQIRNKKEIILPDK